ncbi:MAG: hypothetical protein KF851_04800 [Pirellulaceae bacterium]|nr:hypothetical protein [Pirellulaceae bacterium]
MLNRFRKTDAQFINNAANAIAFWDRWRRVILPFLGLMLIGTVASMFWIAGILSDPNDVVFRNANKISLYVAFLLGSTFGLHLSALLKYVFDAWIGGYRAERMVLNLHSQIAAVKPEEATCSAKNLPNMGSFS